MLLKYIIQHTIETIFICVQIESNGDYEERGSHCSHVGEAGSNSCVNTVEIFTPAKNSPPLAASENTKIEDKKIDFLTSLVCCLVPTLVLPKWSFRCRTFLLLYRWRIFIFSKEALVFHFKPTSLQYIYMYLCRRNPLRTKIMSKYDISTSAGWK